VVCERGLNALSTVADFVGITKQNSLGMFYATNNNSICVNNPYLSIPPSSATPFA
jgi:hypothetical protein